MYDINNLNIGKALRKYRKLKHLSLQYVGDKIYKTKATMSKYENGEITPDFNTVLELCNILDIDLSTLVPSINSICSSNLPFDTDTLYLYYLTSNKLITSTIKIQTGTNNKYLAYFYNGIKNNAENPAYYYEGNIEYFENVAYMNFKNIDFSRLGMERVQIIINLPLSNINNYYNCFITEFSSNFIPVVKKGILSTTSLDKSKINFKKLKVSPQELKRISTDNAWLLDTELHD